MGSITPPKTQVWNKTYVKIFLIITCGVFIPSNTATFPNDSHTKVRQHVEAKRLDSSHQSAPNETASVSSGKVITANNLTSATNGSSYVPLPVPSDPNGGLLTDPSHPPFGAGPVPIAKPSDLVMSPLLTATPSSPTGKSNSSLDSESSKNKQIQGYNNTSDHPVLSGSMAIALPTPSTTAMPAQVTQPPPAANEAVSLTSLSSNTVLEVVTAGEAAPTPTTSTAYVYATNSPVSSGVNNSPASSGSASSTASSSSHDLFRSFIFLLVGSGLALLLVVQLNFL